jgi:hypothetical protein
MTSIFPTTPHLLESGYGPIRGLGSLSFSSLPVFYLQHAWLMGVCKIER